MRAVIGWLVLAAVLYFGLKTDAPTPEKPWLAYGINNGTGKVEWLFLDGYSSQSECSFYVEKSLKDSSYYRRPAGCLYMGIKIRTSNGS
jgi:hypothetical protein